MDGKANDGGLRFGEMERDCLIAYGVAKTQDEKLRILSDGFTIYVCSYCALLAICSFKKKITYCRNCKRGDGLCAIPTTFSTKSLNQDFACIGINMMLEVEKTGEFITITNRD